MSARREGVCYKSCDAFVQSAFFLAGNRTRNGVANVIAFKNLFTLETCFQHRSMFSSILTIRICDRSTQFLVNCFEKIVMGANNSGFYATYLFVSEERRERERRERHGARINTRASASEEDSIGKFMQYLKLVYW